MRTIYIPFQIAKKRLLSSDLLEEDINVLIGRNVLCDPNCRINVENDYDQRISGIMAKVEKLSNQMATFLQNQNVGNMETEETLIMKEFFLRLVARIDSLAYSTYQKIEAIKQFRLSIPCRLVVAKHAIENWSEVKGKLLNSSDFGEFTKYVNNRFKY